MIDKAKCWDDLMTRATTECGLNPSATERYHQMRLLERKHTAAEPSELGFLIEERVGIALAQRGLCNIEATIRYIARDEFAKFHR